MNIMHTPKSICFNIKAISIKRQSLLYKSIIQKSVPRINTNIRMDQILCFLLICPLPFLCTIKHIIPLYIVKYKLSGPINYIKISPSYAFKTYNGPALFHLEINLLFSSIIGWFFLRLWLRNSFDNFIIRILGLVCSVLFFS